MIIDLSMSISSKGHKTWISRVNFRIASRYFQLILCSGFLKTRFALASKTFHNTKKAKIISCIEPRYWSRQSSEFALLVGKRVDEIGQVNGVGCYEDYPATWQMNMVKSVCGSFHSSSPRKDYWYKIHKHSLWHFKIHKDQGHNNKQDSSPEVASQFISSLWHAVPCIYARKNMFILLFIECVRSWNVGFWFI